MEVRLSQQKALPPMFVTEFGMITEVRSQPLKALFPMLVTELGIVTEVRPLQPENILNFDNQPVTF